MTTTKILQITRDIEIARCKGHWESLVELARRYKKYCPGGTVLEQTILTEAILARLRQSERKTLDDCELFETACPLQHLDSSQVRPVQEQLEAAIEAQEDDDAAISLSKEFAKIVLARTYFECGDYDNTLAIVQHLSFHKDDVQSGYSLVLFLQARAMKAMAHERTGNIETALQSYIGIAELLDRVSEYKDVTLVDWAEEGLYRAVHVVVDEKVSFSVSSSLDILRAYYKLTAAKPPTWRTDKRMIALRHAALYISKSYAQGAYLPAVNVLDQLEDTPDSRRQAFANEIMQIHTSYEKMLLLAAKFPSAGELNQAVIDFVNQVAADVSLIPFSALELRGFIELLDRASQRTFNSPCITRHLFYALVQIGDYREAEHTLRSYMYLNGLSSQAWEESRHLGDALVIDASGASVPALNFEKMGINEMVEQSITDTLPESKPSIASSRSNENEDMGDIVRVLVTASKLYCGPLCSGMNAIEMAEIARKKWSQTPVLSNHRDLALGAQVYRTAGAAYSFLATQTSDAVLRSKYQEKGLEYLKESIDLDPEAWETHYQLALQYAEMRDIAKAIQAVAKSLQTKSNHVASWHLLALLCSCPVQKDMARALKSCEIGLKEAMEVDHEMSADLAEQQMYLKITETLLVEAHHGTGRAMQAQPTLFGMYGKLGLPEMLTLVDNMDGDPLVQQSDTILSGSLGNLADLAERRRRGFSVSSHYTEHMPLDASNIAASRSHDDVLQSRFVEKHTLSRRTPSISSLGVKRMGDSPSFLTVPNGSDRGDSESVTPAKSHSHHHLHHGLHLFSSLSSSSRRAKRDRSLSIFNSATSTDTSLDSGSKRPPSKMSLSPYLQGTSGSTSGHLSTPSIRSTLSAGTLLQPRSPYKKPTALECFRSANASRILVSLWLLSAHLFLKEGKMEEALKAIGEAETADWTGNAQVWCALGRLRLKENRIDSAILAFQKGLTVNVNDVECRVWLARAFMMSGNTEEAEGLLESTTQGNGWNCAEAWYLLGVLYQQTTRFNRSKDCLLYALELEATQPIAPLSVLPRCV